MARESNRLVGAACLLNRTIITIITIIPMPSQDVVAHLRHSFSDVGVVQHVRASIELFSDEEARQSRFVGAVQQRETNPS